LVLRDFYDWDLSEKFGNFANRTRAWPRPPGKPRRHRKTHRKNRAASPRAGMAKFFYIIYMSNKEMHNQQYRIKQTIYI
jgi:hypothetical protein